MSKTHGNVRGVVWTFWNGFAETDARYRDLQRENFIKKYFWLWHVKVFASAVFPLIKEDIVHKSGCLTEEYPA
jgi:hypothetical protein